MNPEQIIFRVGELLNKWHREEDTPCVLYVKDGIVHCCDKANLPVKVPSHLHISRHQQTHGLTNKQWMDIGTTLFNLMQKENKCQTPPQP